MLYRQHRIPLLATYRQQTVRAHLEILERHIARDRVIDDLSQHDVDSYALARRSGTLESPHGTIRNELTTLMAVLNWGVVFRLGGRRLLPTSTSWRSRDGVRRASCARATSTRTDRLCSVSSNPPNRARSRAKVGQTRHRRKRIDCAVRPYLGSVTFSPIETSAPVMRSGARRLVGCFLATGRTVIRP